MIKERSLNTIMIKMRGLGVLTVIVHWESLCIEAVQRNTMINKLDIIIYHACTNSIILSIKLKE